MAYMSGEVYLYNRHEACLRVWAVGGLLYFDNDAVLGLEQLAHRACAYYVKKRGGSCPDFIAVDTNRFSHSTLEAIRGIDISGNGKDIPILMYSDLPPSHVWMAMVEAAE